MSGDHAGRAERARRVCLASYGLLLALLAVDVLARTQLTVASRAVYLALQLMPLLLFLPGMLRGAWKTYLWLCFVLLIYLMLAMDRLVQPEGGALQGCQIVLIAVLFTAATLYARWRQRALAATQSEGE